MELNDNELKNVVGGINTGELKNGKVYIKVSGLASLVLKSGYYGIEDIEGLANQYYDSREMIKPYIGSDIKNAVQKLYDTNSAAMPIKVKEFLGL